MKSRILYTKPSITELEHRYASDAAMNCWGDRCYEYINRFEKLFEQHLGVQYAIATSSCTGALHMGMAGLGIGPGDQVIMADSNWIATVSPVVHLGAEPVFVDVMSDSWCLDPALVKEAITSRTKAIVATHLYGNLCDMKSLIDIGEEYGIPVIEDAAEAIGSQYFDNKAGSMGAFGAFSFHGTKTLSTGEGGMFVTSDPDLYEKVLTLSNHGRARSQTKQFWPDMIGFKYKMSNIQAAIGCAQLERVDSLVARKQEILAYYREAFSRNANIQMNPTNDGMISGAWMPTIVFADTADGTVSALHKEFAAENIDARVFFHPLSSLSFFDSIPENRVAYRLAANGVNLPSYHDMTENELKRVVSVVLRIAHG